MINCTWLPELIVCNNFGRFIEYQDVIYELFKKDFILSHPTFDYKRVNIRKHPMDQGKEEAFFHVTCKDYSNVGDRVPDPRRCERIRWVRSFIENFLCHRDECFNCDGIKVWNQPYHSTSRTHIFLSEERYVVVLEKRAEYYLLLTAYYIEEDHSLAKLIRRYERYKAEDAS